MNPKELREKMLAALAKSEVIRLKYQGSSEVMTAQEETEWSNALEEADKYKDLLEKSVKADSLNAWAKQIPAPLPLDGKTAPTDEDEAVIKEAGKKAWRKFLTKSPLTESDYVAISRVTSTKAYQADNPAGGGYLISPMQFVNSILTLMKDLMFIRNKATVYTLDKSESLGVPAVDVDPSDADWTAELGTGNEDTAMAFGRRELKPNPLAKRVKLSNKLLRQAAIDPEGLVRDRLGYKFALTQEKAFLNGTGADQPLGVFTASSLGISTARDVTAANAASIVADDFINVAFKLKAQYRMKSEWILNRAVVQAARKLKDNNNNYIWATGFGPGGAFQGTPPTLLDRPINESEWSPGTITTGLYTAILGDFSFYWIADALDMEFKVLDQLYAETNQTGFIGRMESDGMPVLEEAFARLKQA